VRYVYFAEVGVQEGKLHWVKIDWSSWKDEDEANDEFDFRGAHLSPITDLVCSTVFIVMYIYIFSCSLIHAGVSDNFDLSVRHRI
jgi:hypothetical protein